MLTPLERVNNLLADLRIAPVDFDAIYRGKNKLSPLESVELFLLEEQRIRIQKQNDLRRKCAATRFNQNRRHNTIREISFGEYKRFPGAELRETVIVKTPVH